MFIPRKTYNAAIKAVNEFVELFIDEVLSLPAEKVEFSRQSKYSFLHALAEFTQDRKVLRHQIVAVLLASLDTTAAALSWTFYELSRHPEIVKRLREEIIQTVGLNELPTYDNLKNMKYLQVFSTPPQNAYEI